LLKQLLARYRMNLYEGKEEVIRPRIFLTKLCRQQVRVTPEDIQQAFDTAHGEKVEGRMILYPPTRDGLAQAQKAYGELRDTDDAFDRKAREQYLPKYAAIGGKIRPLGHCAADEPNVDRVLFRLRPGEVSEVVSTREGPAVFKCIRRIPAEPI